MGRLDDRAERIGDLLATVFDRNPFQRARVAGAAPSRLADVPPLTKAELVADQRRHEPFGSNLTFPFERYVHLHQTSGTTGPPLRVLDTAEDWEWWCEGLAKTYRAAGIGPADRVALAFSFGPHVQFWASKAGLERIGALVVPLGGMSSVQRLRTFRDIGATAVVCTPGYALRLEEVAVAEGLEECFATVENVVCTGEPGASLPAVRARIEEALGARCHDHAGLSEVGPFGYPCPAGGVHVDEQEFVCEVLDENLAPVADGERGELVLTPLGRIGYPVLRYRTGDLVVGSAERCPLGHHDRWLPGGVLGRTDDMVVIRGMNVFPSAVDEAVRNTRGAGDYHLVFYTDPNGMDEVKLEVELADGGSARALYDTMRQQLDLRVRVVPVGPGVLRRSGRRAGRVTDLRGRRR
jgi:phenylacetate-CoA ligase